MCKHPGCGKRFRWRSSIAHHHKSHLRRRSSSSAPVFPVVGLTGNNHIKIKKSNKSKDIALRHQYESAVVATAKSFSNVPVVGGRLNHSSNGSQQQQQQKSPMDIDEGHGSVINVDEDSDDDNSKTDSHEERSSLSTSTPECHEPTRKLVKNNNQLLSDAVPVSGNPCPLHQSHQSSVTHPPSTKPRPTVYSKPLPTSHVVVSDDDDDDDDTDGTLPTTLLGMITNDCPSASSTSARKQPGTGTDYTANVNMATNKISPPMMIAITNGVNMDDVDVESSSVPQDREEEHHQAIMRYEELSSPQSSINDCDKYDNDNGDDHSSNEDSILSPEQDCRFSSLSMSAITEGVGEKMEPELFVHDDGQCNNNDIAAATTSVDRTIDGDMKDTPSSPVSPCMSSPSSNGECDLIHFPAWNCDDDDEMNNNNIGNECDEDVPREEEDELKLGRQHEYWSHDTVDVNDRDCVGDMRMYVHVNMNVKLNYDDDDNGDDDEQNSEDGDIVFSR